MSVWDWLHESAQRSYEANDRERISLIETYARAMQFQDREPALAEALLRQGRATAALLNEPWWVQFYDHWILQILICHSRDYGKALDLAVQAALETRKPAYRQFPQRICLHEDLINTYLGIDPEGYAPLIAQALDYMAQEVDPSAECVHCVNELRTEFAVRLNHQERGEECALAALQAARAAGDELHSATAFCMLCTLAHRRGSTRILSEYADEAVRSSFASGHNASILSALMWQAVAARTSGDERAAVRSIRTALARANQVGSAPTEEFYDAMEAFHLLAGEYDFALQARRRELTEMEGKGQTWREVRTQLRLCGLMQMLGAPAEELRAEIGKAETAAARLKSPAPALQEAARLRANITA